ncbi:MAG: glycosyltransferase, partial [Terriglobus sp.]
FDAVITVSEVERLYAISLGVDEAKIHTIGNGVDAAKVLGRVAANPPMRDSDVKVIGFIGRLVHQKNPLLFIQVIAQLIARGLPVRARIIGDGPLRDHLQEFAAQLKIAERIDWCGAVSAVEEIGNIDVLVHTSHYESSPYSLLEAVAANVPVVAVANAGSCSLFEEHLQEALVSSMDFRELADGVETVLFNPALRQHYTRKYNAILLNHSVDTMVDRTIAIYERVLTPHLKSEPTPELIAHA